jgi:hypothetical protein
VSREVVPVSVFVMVTLAPGIAAPDWSLTIPTISPEIVVCALRLPGVKIAMESAKIKANTIFTVAIAERCGQGFLMTPYYAIPLPLWTSFGTNG